MKQQPTTESQRRRTARACRLTVRCSIAFLLALPWGAGADSLRQAAETRPPLRIGAAVGASTLTGTDAAYASNLRVQFQLPSPENALKWATLRPDQYTFRWTDPDAIVRFAQAAGQQVRGHTLLWHNSVPAWLSSGGFNPDQLRDLLFHHIDTVVGRYRGSTFCWDVVNEAFNSDGTLRSTLWYNQPGMGYATNGTRYIEEAFRRAHSADPAAELIYNDYSIEADNAKSDAVYAMAQDFRSRGVPLHGIGFQMHLGSGGLSYTSLRSNLQRFNALGLSLHITEMDVRILVDTNGVATPADLATQAEVYWNVLSVALANPRFTVFQTWGFTDAHSWIPSTYTNYGAALPFDADYQKKPAYYAIWNALANQAETLPFAALSAGDTSDLVTNSLFSAGAARRLVSEAIDDYVTLSANVPRAGLCGIKVGVRKEDDGGEFQLAFAAAPGGSYANVAVAQDTYASTDSYVSLDLGSTSFPAAGNYYFRFTVTGKNTSSSGYRLVLDYLRITPAATNFNTPPVISSVGDQTSPKNASLGPIAFTLGDAETAASDLSVSAASLNTNLVSDSSILLGGSGSNRTVTLTPAAGQSGLVGILLTVSDGTNETSETFTWNITPVNASPALATTNLSIAANGFLDIDLAGLASDAETPADGLTFGVSNPSNGTVTLLSDGHTARFTPPANYFGPAWFRCTATDQGPDPRWLLCYDFEPPDAADDKSVTDLSPNRLPGTLEEYGTGAGAFDASVPLGLARFSTASLRLTEAGATNGARLSVLVGSTLYSLKNADWTFATWFRRATATNDEWLFHIGAGNGAAGDGDELELRWNSTGQIQLDHYNTTNAQDVSLPGGTVPIGDWHHVAVVFDRTNNNAGALSLYVDGALKGTAGVSWSLNQTKELIFGGVKKGSEDRWLNGWLDDLVIYRAVLTPAEIARLAGGCTVGHLGGASATNTISLNVIPPNRPPVLPALTNQTIIAGATLSVTNGAYDPDSPSQTLAFVLLSAPAGAAINATNGLLTWRPTLAQAGATNRFTVVVTEAGWVTNLAPVADAFVRDGSLASSNYGSDSVLAVRLAGTGFTRESYLKFSLTDVLGSIADARLQLWPVFAAVPAVHALAVATNDAWTELTLTWNSKPNSDSALVTWFPQLHTLVDLPVAAPAQQALADDRLLSLRVYATNTTSDRIDYGSREGAVTNAPALLVTSTNSTTLTATQSFWVSVLAPATPSLTDPLLEGGLFSFAVNGDTGPDYSIQATTNLSNPGKWLTLFTANSPTLPFRWADTNTGGFSERYYRIRLGP